MVTFALFFILCYVLIVGISTLTERIILCGRLFLNCLKAVTRREYLGRCYKRLGYSRIS